MQYLFYGQVNDACLIYSSTKKNLGNSSVCLDATHVEIRLFRPNYILDYVLGQYSKGCMHERNVFSINQQCSIGIS